MNICWENRNHVLWQYFWRVKVLYSINEMHVFCLCGLEVESKLLQELCENTDGSIFSTTSKVKSQTPSQQDCI